ncbi:hypothetical protein DL771_005230 [Monosporascus sp. 5C6A]|nr:hypothetical protein DL771_005230 [Monosporascus sp. 5C6A]
MASFFRSTIMWRGGGAASAAQSPNLEAQRRQPEMEEQPQQQHHQEEPSRGSFPLSRRFMPALFTRGRSSDTERREPVGDEEGGSSRASDDWPKTPQLPSMPPARLDLPTNNIGRTWVRESSGQLLPPRHETAPPQQPPPLPSSSAESPASRRSSVSSLANTAQYPGVATPQPARQRSESGGRRRFEGPDPAELHLAALADSGRRRNRHRHRHRHERTQSGSRRSRGHHRRGVGDKEVPGSFLFCFPWVRSRRMRAQILKCFVSGLLMVATLSVYLTLSMGHRITSTESTVLLILIVLLATIIFCHGLVRICMLLKQRQRGATDGGDLERGGRGGSSSRHHHHDQQHPYYLRNNRHQQPQMAEVTVAGGYAVPRRPIRVVLARDEEAAGREAETAKVKPPAYGAWRESVRVDPNRLYWHRIDGHHHHHQAPGSMSESSSDDPGYSQTRPGSADTGTGIAARPPSYASDDGVAYVVEARPRSIAPLSDVAGSVSGSSSYYGVSERGGPRSSSSGGTAWPTRSARSPLETKVRAIKLSYSRSKKDRAALSRAKPVIVDIDEAHVGQLARGDLHG